MSNEQNKEIETIRERNITVRLSDADCEKLVRKCGEHGLTVGELIENFVGDLVGGTYSNGSDERMYADQWFNRCRFGMSPEPTLLNHLLGWEYDPKDYLNVLDNIETAIKDKEYLVEHPEEANEEAQYLDDDIESWQEELKDMRAEWKPEKEPNMEEELELIKKWVKERDNLINEKVKKETVVNFAVAVLAEVGECAKQEDAPIYKGDKEVDMWVRLSDVEDAINKHLN